MKHPRTHLPLQFVAVLVFTSLSLLATTAVLTNLSRVQVTTGKAAVGANANLSYSVSPAIPLPNQPVTVEFHINTNGNDISGIEMRNLTLTTNTGRLKDTPSAFKTDMVTKLTPLVNTAQAISDPAVKASYLSTLTNPGTPYNTGTTTFTFATLTFTPDSAGSVTLHFDPNYTHITKYGSNGQDIAKYQNDQGITIYPAGTATPTPTPTPAGATPTPGPCSIPQTPDTIKARSGTNPGEIIVSWGKPGNVDHYAVSYGTGSRKYEWGSPNIGNTNEFILRFLSPGTRYYIAVSAVNNCGGSAYSPEVSAVAAGKKAATGTTTTTYTKPQVIVMAPEKPLATPTPQPTITPTVPSPSPAEASAQAGDLTLPQRLVRSPFFWIILLFIVGGFIVAKLFGGGYKEPQLITPETPIPHEPFPTTDQPPANPEQPQPVNEDPHNLNNNHDVG